MITPAEYAMNNFGLGLATLIASGRPDAPEAVLLEMHRFGVSESAKAVRRGLYTEIDNSRVKSFAHVCLDAGRFDVLKAVAEAGPLLSGTIATNPGSVNWGRSVWVDCISGFRLSPDHYHACSIIRLCANVLASCPAEVMDWAINLRPGHDDIADIIKTQLPGGQRIQQSQMRIQAKEVADRMNAAIDTAMGSARPDALLIPKQPIRGLRNV